MSAALCFFTAAVLYGTCGALILNPFPGGPDEVLILIGFACLAGFLMWLGGVA